MTYPCKVCVYIDVYSGYFHRLRVVQCPRVTPDCEDLKAPLPQELFEHLLMAVLQRYVGCEPRSAGRKKGKAPWVSISTSLGSLLAEALLLPTWYEIWTSSQVQFCVPEVMTRAPEEFWIFGAADADKTFYQDIFFKASVRASWGRGAKSTALGRKREMQFLRRMTCDKVPWRIHRMH